MGPIIKVDNLGKQYRIGARQSSHPTLRDSIAETLRSRFNRLRGNKNHEGAAIWALKDVSFEVAPGEVVGVIGRNGAGKSTLLKILSRITDPTTGKVDIYGRVGSLLEVGTGFHVELSGRENIYLNGAILGMKRNEINRKFDEIVTFAEIGKFIDTPVKHYSSGMYMRLAFAVAAHLEPEILLVDEVLAVGDANFQKKCLGKMREVGKEGRTVLFVSHNLAATQQLCDRTMLVDSGCVVEDGRTSTVIAKYLNESIVTKDGFFDLASHPSRPAKFQPVIRHIAFYSIDGTPATTYGPEDALIAEIYLKAEFPQSIEDARVAFSIDDSFGRRVTTIFSDFDKGEMGAIHTGCRVRCTLPRIGLTPGRYLVSIGALNKYRETIDELEYIAWFDIYCPDDYESGWRCHPKFGPLLTSSVWECV